MAAAADVLVLVLGIDTYMEGTVQERLDRIYQLVCAIKIIRYVARV
jgi:hypothetical protein